MRAYVIPAAAIAALTAGAAVAGGYEAPQTEAPVAYTPAPAAPVADWTGFYVGGQLGYGDAEAGAVEGDGPVGGVHAGYNWDFGNFVVGAEAAYNDTDIELGGGGSIDDVTSLRLNAGYDLGNGLLPYLSVGGAQASANIGGVELEDTGWLAGAGLAYDLGNSWVVGGDVTYHEFEDFDATGVDVDVTTVTARVSYRF
ncbi:outer membrane beta-barrel protein [Rhodobacterales bacterium HKCCE2091]|nr:outer membrane beta-barrel protein [Rhodobacterales bacterium HKCCE2091]